MRREGAAGSGAGAVHDVDDAGGMPASAIRAASRSAVSGVSSDGFATQQFPAAMAGAIFQVSRYSGRFQGEISPATPSGARMV